MCLLGDQLGRREHGGGSGGRTDANDEGADCEAGDGVFDQVRSAGSQQGGRGAHAGVIVGRLEGFAADVRTACWSGIRGTHYPMAAAACRGEASVKRRNPIPGFGRGGEAAAAAAERAGQGRAGLGTSIHQQQGSSAGDRHRQPSPTRRSTLDARRLTLDACSVASTFRSASIAKSEDLSPAVSAPVTASYCDLLRVELDVARVNQNKQQQQHHHHHHLHFHLHLLAHVHAHPPPP
jgi:hypothetical protein